MRMMKDGIIYPELSYKIMGCAGFVSVKESGKILFGFCRRK